jgi:hypothetical protein
MSQRGATNGRERGDELAVVEFGELPLGWKISLRTVKFLARLERERSRLKCRGHNQSFSFRTRPTASTVDIFMQLLTAHLE